MDANGVLWGAGYMGEEDDDGVVVTMSARSFVRAYMANARWWFVDRSCVVIS